MRITFFCYSLSGAGPRVRAKNLIEALATTTDHDITVITSADESFSHPEVSVHRYLSPESLLDPREIVRTRRLLSSAEVIHVPVNFYQLLYTRVLTETPIVAGAGIQHERRFRVATRFLDIEQMIETHEFVAAVWQDSGVPAEYVYPAVDTERFSPATPAQQKETRERLGLDPESEVVLFVGALKPLKGAQLLPGLSAELNRPNLEVLVVGDGELRQRIEDAPGLRCEGFVENSELPAYYRAADVTVVPSEKESFSIVSLESVACGTPVVTTTRDSSDMAKLFKPRGTYLWADRTPEAIAEQVERLLDDPNLYQRQVTRARETIEEMGLSTDDVVEKYLSVYTRAAERR